MAASATSSLCLLDRAPSPLSRPYILPCNRSSTWLSSSRSRSFQHPKRSGLKINRGCRAGFRGVRAMMQSSSHTVEDKLGIKIERNPSEDRISSLSIKSWPKWGCPPSKFPWTYDATETCYLLKGKVKVYPEGSSDYVEIGAGDLVIFQKGMSCTWDVISAVDKHYTFS
ncbi:hypothetical protein O6H91_17G049800 [Diphasiastrum complanatum]|uniref:Uncharacterized protein n=1 Tax=Diphasiastrum complanatum TaxID=34168 RepID=A0ACC2B6Q4_DIPCM|nr:hypothetical protein O6H91_17G049800 [Diphasiastrum complanatum]